jgi:hypothetical protein
MDSKPDPHHSLALEITRGQTAHPMRPIRSDRFLIGSGEWCHLRLGGNTPALHSVLVNKNGVITIEAIAAEPALIVNGQTVESAEIQEGDELAIGSITLKLHGQSVSTTDPLMQPIDIDAMLALDQPATPATELSASELVEKLEADMSMVGSYEDGREDSAAALIETASQSTADATADQANRPLRILQELETAVHSLNRIAADLTQDSHEMNDQEVNQAASSLVDYQQQIVGRLDDVLLRIAELNETDSVSIDQQKVA